MSKLHQDNSVPFLHSPTFPQSSVGTNALDCGKDTAGIQPQDLVFTTLTNEATVFYIKEKKHLQ